MRNFRPCPISPVSGWQDLHFTRNMTCSDACDALYLDEYGEPLSKYIVFIFHSLRSLPPAAKCLAPRLLHRRIGE